MIKLNTTLYLLIAGFVFSLFIFGGAIYTSYKSEEKLFADFKEVESAHNVMNDLTQLTRLIDDFENSRNSFEYSKNDYFLNQFYEKEKLVIDKISKMRNALKINGLDSASFQVLNRAIEQRMLLAGKQIENIKSSNGDSSTYAKIGSEEVAQKKLIYSKINEFKIVQEEMLNKTHNEMMNRFTTTRVNLTVVGYSAALFTLLIFLFIWQYSKTHQKIENDLVELNENKNKFFSIISHDLRGPVKNIVLMAQLLYQPANKTIDPGKMAKLIESSANNLSSLLDNLLKWSRLQMNKIDFQPETVDLQKLADDVILNLNVHADQKSISIQNLLLPNTSVFIDQNMIATVIRNLISNALKFTNKGGFIEIYSSQNNDFVTVTVKDNGVGMPNDIASKIFSIDFKHVTKGTNKEEGTGLGLKLCKEFIEKNHGKIWVESDFGNGSKFIFTIPIHSS